MTLAATLWGNRKDIPKQILPSKQRCQLSTTCVYSQNTVLASYFPTQNKSVILLSILHQTFYVSKNEYKKKNNVYNSTKSKLDTVDKMARHYLGEHGTRRWSLGVCFYILDLACLSAYVHIVNFYMI